MKIQEIRDRLLAHCVEHGLFSTDARCHMDEDLVESGLVDSMGLVTLHCLIEEVYGVSIPAPIFVAELRTLNRIASYIDGAVAARGARHPELGPSTARS